MAIYRCFVQNYNMLLQYQFLSNAESWIQDQLGQLSTIMRSVKRT